MKAYADNVFIEFLPEPTMTASGLHLPQSTTAQTRRAKVVAVGPGYYTSLGVLVPTTVKPGETVLVDRMAGQNYDWDLSVPRHNKKGCDFSEDGRGWRAVREQEILAVIDE